MTRLETRSIGMSLQLSVPAGQQLLQHILYMFAIFVWDLKEETCPNLLDHSFRWSMHYIITNFVDLPILGTIWRSQSSDATSRLPSCGVDMVHDDVGLLATVSQRMEMSPEKQKDNAILYIILKYVVRCGDYIQMHPKTISIDTNELPLAVGTCTSCS